MNQGLAGQGTLALDGTGQGQRQGRQLVDEVKAMLMQGASPEELVASGIPEEIIMQAIQELEQELATQQQTPVQAEPVTQAGLAARGTM